MGINGTTLTKTTPKHSCLKEVVHELVVILRRNRQVEAQHGELGPEGVDPCILVAQILEDVMLVGDFL
jgi:hypothetical protein